MVRVKSQKKRNKEKVLILLSSYNGEKYISQQLDSLLAQTYPVDILIRDDGSTDSTVSIIDSYMKSNDNIKLIRGSNVGFKRSFDLLINNKLTNDYEFAAFCDQDDIWMPDKIEAAIKKITIEYDPQVPTMYCSNLSRIDDSNNYLGDVYYKQPSYTRYNAIVINIATGCTMVFNHSAVALYRYGGSCDSKYHDWQMYLICMFLGKVYFDMQPHIKYRIHGENTVGFKRAKGWFEALCSVCKSVLMPKKKSERVRWIKSFSENYKRFLSVYDHHFLDAFGRHEDNVIYRIMIALDPKISARVYSYNLGFCGAVKPALAFRVDVLINRVEKLAY